jgi:hypothetical protein
MGEAGHVERRKHSKNLYSNLVETSGWKLRITGEQRLFDTCVCVIYSAKAFRQMNLVSEHQRTASENVRRGSCLLNENVQNKPSTICSVCPYVIARNQVYGFSWNLIRSFTEMYSQIMLHILLQSVSKGPWPTRTKNIAIYRKKDDIKIYRKITDIIGIYRTITDNIGIYWTVTENIEIYCTVTDNIVIYRTITDNIGIYRIVTIPEYIGQ